MEDGPEAAEGSYTYGARTYRLEERESEVWTVLDGDGAILGTITALPATPDAGVCYSVDVPGETEAEDVPTTDWKAALEYVIEQSS